MYRGFWLAVLLLPVGGCYVTPSDTGYAQPGYPPPGYPNGGYAPDPYAAYPGYNYNDGAPTIVEGGAPVPLVLYGGEWGYYDSGRRWHRAPEGVSRDLQAHGGPGGDHRDEHGGGYRGDHRDEHGGEGRPPPTALSQPVAPARPPPGGGRYSGSAYRPGEPPRSGPPPSGGPRPANPEPPRQHECPPGQRC